jgi:predicted nucleotidyltransferase
MTPSNREEQSWTRQAILDTLAQHRAALHNMGVQKIGLFGSHIQGTATPDSDVDFLVVLSKPSFDSYMDLKFYLEDLFGHKVDLVQEKTIKPRLRPYIMAEVVYAA